MADTVAAVLSNPSTSYISAFPAKLGVPCNCHTHEIDASAVGCQTVPAVALMNA